MAEENQVQQEPQQVTTKEPKRVTTKDQKKVEVGKRLAALNRKRREVQNVKTTEWRAASEGPSGGMSQYYSIGFSYSFSAGAVLAVEVIGGLGYHIYQFKEAQQPSHPQQNSPPKQPPKSNKFEMD